MSDSIIEDILFDAYDMRSMLRFNNRDVLAQPKDSDGTETTIGDCLDNIIERLEELDTEDYRDE